MSIIIGTGSYDNVKNGNTLSITGDGGNAWQYFGNAYKKLAPKLETYLPYANKLKELENIKDELNDIKKYLMLKKQIEDEYIYSYYELRLKNLDVYSLLNKLHKKYGEDIILLCHENIDEFCHRRLVADYIELITHQYIPEVKVDNNGNISKVNPIRYKNRLREVIRKY